MRPSMAAKKELKKVGLTCLKVDLEHVIVEIFFTDLQLEDLKSRLKKSGAQEPEDQEMILLARIKNEIITMVYDSKEMPTVNFPAFLTAILGHDYTYLSRTFSANTGTTIEQFISVQKVDRAKELIIYDELSLKEICHLLNYKSVAHLSSEIKKITGLPPAHFKKIKQKRSDGQRM